MRHLAAGTALLCLVAAGCASDGDDAAGPSSDGTTAPASSSAAPVALPGTTNDHGTKDLAGNDELEVELDDFYFGPTYIKAAAGSTVKVELRNEGKAPHTFTIDAMKIDETLQPDGEKDVTVTLPASGNVVFYCKFHRAQGMQGAFFFAPGGSAASGSADSGGAYGQ